MRRLVVLLLTVTLSATVPASVRAQHMKRCDQVCQPGLHNLVPCGGKRSDVVIAKRGAPAALTCDTVRGLTSRQRAFCRRHADLLPALLDGVRRGNRECRRRFRHHRWNCHVLGHHLEFGHVQVKGTPETAVWYALQSAAITLAVYRACKRGELASCSCGSGGQRAYSLERWKWTGCRRGLVYSAKKARKFLNTREQEQDVRSLVNKHNNKVGIRLVSRQGRSRRRVRCLSGICTSAGRWPEQGGSLAVIGATLAAARHTSQLVTLGADGALVAAGSGAAPSRRRLVHLVPSPSYCEPDPETGFEGTAGRPCRKNSSADGSCAELCCGRGHKTQIVRQVFCCNYHINPAEPTVCRQEARVRECN